MYYEEKVIDGILSHRGTPDGEWIPFTAQALTVALVAMRGAYEDAKAHLDCYEARLEHISAAVEDTL